MNFKVIFEPKETYNDAYRMKSQTTGIKHLDIAREVTGVKNLLPEKVKDNIPSIIRRTATIEISEETARESGYFYETGEVVVKIFDQALNPFCEIQHQIQKNNETGEIEEVVFFWELNRAKVIDWWADLGYPLEIEVAK